MCIRDSLSTAQKKKVVTQSDHNRAVNQMCALNDIGAKLSNLKGINAVTDVTGFGLAGHLLEVCKGSKVSAEIYFDKLPLLPNILEYIKNDCVPGGTVRNFESYGRYLGDLSEIEKSIICDPQTSGGLLVSISNDGLKDFLDLMKSNTLDLQPIGKILDYSDKNKTIIIK